MQKVDFTHPEFKHMINRMAVWYRLRRAIDGFQQGLLFGLAMAFAFSLVMITTGMGLRFGLGKLELARLLILSALGGGATVGLVVFFWPVPIIRTARFFDQFFGLSDRISTAVELLRAVPINAIPTHAKHAHAIPTGRLSQLQIEDAIAHGTSISPRTGFFLSISRQRLSLTVLLAACIALVSFFGQPYFQRVIQRQALQQAVQQEIISLEELRQSVSVENELLSEDQAEIDQILRESIEKLEQAETTEQAVAILTQTEDQLRSLENPDLQEQVQTLQELGDQMLSAENPVQNPLQGVGNELTEGDFSSAAQSIQDIDLESLTDEEQASLSDQLADAAETASASNPELADNLRQAAETLQAGDIQSAQSALAQAAQELTQTSSQQALNETAEQAADQVGQSARQIIQSGLDQQAAQAGTGAGGQSGSSDQSGSGQAGGQGSEAGDSQSSGDQGGSGAGSGAGKGSTDQGDITGGEAGQDPITQENGPGDGGVRAFEPLENPQRLGGTGSMDVYLPSSGAEGEDVLGLENVSPGDESTSTVPYTQIFPVYSEIYRRAVESGAIPPSLRSLVRDYFSHLEP